MIRQLLRNYYKSIFVGILISWLSLSEDSSLNPGNFLNIPYLDKIGHFSIYLLFTTILLLDSGSWQRDRPFKYVLLFIPVIIGAMMEVLQRLVTIHRHADIIDMAANVSGIISGIILAHLVKRFLDPGKSDL